MDLVLPKNHVTAYLCEVEQDGLMYVIFPGKNLVTEMGCHVEGMWQDHIWRQLVR